MIKNDYQIIFFDIFVSTCLSIFIELQYVDNMDIKLQIYQPVLEFYKNSMMEEMEFGEDIVAAYSPYENNRTIWKTTVVSKQEFRLPQNYEIVQSIGSGAYSTVVAAIDHNCQEPEKKMVAIKKMTNVFEHKIFARRILRELKMLRLLKHDNIVELKTIILPESRFKLQAIYCVFQFVQRDLFALIKQKSQILPEYYQMIIYQILRALKYIHSAQIIHRDLKPRNILIDSECDVKLCDFGLSRHMSLQHKSAMTEYVITRWYRPPELLLGQTQYTTAIDIWSLGCIIIQMFTKKPFMPANSSQHQLQLICEMIKIPQNWKSEDTGMTNMLKDLVSKKKKANRICKLESKLAGFPSDLKDLITKMLAFDASQRITVQEALSHPYLQQFHVQEDEPSRQPISEAQFEFQCFPLSTEQLKDLLYEQILIYHYPLFKEQYQQKIKNKQSVVTHIVNNSNSKKINPNTDYDMDEEEDDDLI